MLYHICCEGSSCIPPVCLSNVQCAIVSQLCPDSTLAENIWGLYLSPVGINGMYLRWIPQAPALNYMILHLGNILSLFWMTW